MDFACPRTWAEALEVQAQEPDTVPICGGTDVMVDVNFDRRRPAALLDLTRVRDLQGWSHRDGRIVLGAGVTYARVIDELGDRLPGLAMAARTVGSPQIRNRGTVGGNLGAASPAGDSHPPLLATETVVVAESVRGARRIEIADFYTGVKRNALEPDELIREIEVEVAGGPQQFSKIGPRNAMVIAVAGFALALHPDVRRVGTGLGSASPTPRRAAEAEVFVAAEFDERGLWESRSELPESVAEEFGRRVGLATEPIDDVRGSAAYRKHAISVLARRALTWAWSDYRRHRL
ncbi:FAD binding domain-containing protein [Solicola gregarius]|uniref:FAD binding domain-containing protein n=1 Tax=Solicola gregarius TaxID=2908642 RepID=A0AA46THV2_9ACTN|nr:FAD binding domain-containing protein [Solicola gregarius]UYM05545.1 FAD binding domain-containing protein [Solicola gregarius]